MSISSFSVRQPVFVNLIMILVIVGGIMSYRMMPKDQYPDVGVGFIQVTTLMPGASPKEIEQLITIPIEEEVDVVDEVKSVISISADNMSTVVLEMDPKIDIFRKITEIQNQIDLVENLPEDAESPIVQEILIPFELMTICLVGNAPELEVKEFADDLLQRVKEVDGVRLVVVTGLREREIWVEVDPLRLQSYGLSLTQVADTLRARNLNMPAGSIKMGRGEFVVRTEAEFENIDEIMGTILKDDGHKDYVYLRDVATVTDTFEDRSTVGRIDGRNSVNLTIKKTDRSNAIDVVAEIKEIVEELRPRLPAGIQYQIVNDASIEIQDRLRGLYSNALLGLLLVCASFTFFIGVRAALMVALGLPVAMFGTFIFLNMYGFSINTIVLFSLIVVLGLVVDDAIVVCENIYRHFEEGVPLKEAAILGTEEITLPVIATVLTTMAAFLPLLLMGGTLGKFMSIIPITVSLALASSLVECLFILPAHVADWGAPHHKRDKAHAVQPWLLRLIARYNKFLDFLLSRHILGFLSLRYVVIAVVFMMAAGSVWLAAFSGRMDFILFGGRDLQKFALTVETPPGASLEETERLMLELERRALNVMESSSEVKHIRTNVGSMESAGRGVLVAANLAEVNVELVPLAERERMGQAVKSDFRKEIMGVAGYRSMTFEDTRDGPPTGKPVQIRIRGDSFETLQTIAEEVKAYLRTVEGIEDVMDNFPPGKDEVQPSLDLEKVAGLGLNVNTIAMEVRGAFDGIEATTVHDGEEEIDVVVKYSRDYRSSIGDLEEMSFATSSGMVPFSNFGKIKRTSGFSSISHYNQKRAVNVLADTVTGVITSQQANNKAKEHFADIGIRYPGYTLDYGGEYEDTQDSLTALVRAFLLSIILIYVILGGLFASFLQPLVVMFAVPFSFIGAIMGFYIMDQPLGMFAIIGIIALAGIVVNDSLILIEFINSRRRRGVGRRESIVAAGSARLRPIILTSITTVCGLMPMSIGLFGVDQFLRPMALSIVWGLSFATLLTLIVIPCVYAVADDMTMLVIKRPLGLNWEQFDALKTAKQSTEASAPGALVEQPAHS